ncbi:hypothetical protein ABH935_006660 [Catenulispora sp. GAS73]|uniref:amidohydrolase family protein n=1 Tax=Catenulispora sp. GAS73 TaxID=3156269 RepID=UPI003515C82B
MVTGPGSADPGIDRFVRELAAIDDHAHPIPLEWEPPPDRDRPIFPYDHPLPVRMRPTSPEYIDAWRALWGYEHDDFDDGHLRALIDKKQQVQAAEGDNYHSWVLDRINVETMLAVDSFPQPSFPAPRFRWLAFDDWLMWPVPAVGQKPITGRYAEQMAQTCRQAGVDCPPPTLDDYVHAVLAPVLDQQKADGAVGLKFHTPYYRPIDFAEVPVSQARELYRRACDSGITIAEHRHVEDYLFAAIAGKAAELDLPIQMHTGQGPRHRFENKGSNPMLMEAAVVAAPDTRFLMLHAGWPFTKEAVASLSHPNVFLDISGSSVHLYARNLAGIVRGALEWFPEKILYGTDAFSDTAHAFMSSTEPRSNFLHGWEEKAWLLDRTAREAIALALTDMLHDRVVRAGDVDRLATMMMRDNAVDLYRL